MNADVDNLIIETLRDEVNVLRQQIAIRNEDLERALTEREELFKSLAAVITAFGDAVPYPPRDIPEVQDAMNLLSKLKKNG